MSYTRSSSPVFTDGQTMTYADVWGEFALVRTALQGAIAAADVDANVVGHEHIYPSRVRGFPVEGADGEFQSSRAAAVVHDGLKLDPEQTLAVDRCNKTRRFDMFHRHLNIDGTTSVPGLTKVINVHTAGTVCIEAQWSVVTSDDSQGATPPARGDSWGYFAVFRGRPPAETGSPVVMTEIPHTRRNVYARYSRVAQNYSVLGCIDISANLGRQVFAVRYVRTGITAHTSGNACVSIGNRHINLDYEPEA